MGLSIAQMGRVSQLLDEALVLDETGRRRWLERLPPEHQDLAAALWAALLPAQDQGMDLNAISALPRLGSMEDAATASGLQGGAQTPVFGLSKAIRFSRTSKVTPATARCCAR
jgi:hypothetical protein